MRDALISEPALVDGARYELAPTGVVSPGHGRSWWVIELGNEGELTSVASEILQGGTEAYVQHTAETRRLDALAGGLADPEAWLDDEFWVGPSAPFEPESYMVWVNLRTFLPDMASGTMLDEIAPPFDPRTVGQPVDSGTNERCAVLPSTDIGPLVERIDAALAGEWAAGHFDWPVERLSVEIAVHAVLAPRTPDCP